MPKPETIARARRDKAQGKSASTQAGEFVREEIDDIRAGKHGARSPQQAIAIGLSKARRAGVALKPPSSGKTSTKTRRQAERDYERGQGASPRRAGSAKRAAASKRALKREPHDSVSKRSLSAHAKTAASRRSRQDRSAASRQASRTRAAHAHP